MSGHTPGPWTINDARTVEGDFMVCAGEGHGYGIVAQVTLKEDADLIASLPALVAERDALRGAMATPLSEAERKLIDKHCDWIGFGHAWNAVMKGRRAALSPSHVEGK